MDTFSAARSERQNISLGSDTTAVLIVDMLHDFCDPAGAMCLPGAERLYLIQNDLIQSARLAALAPQGGRSLTSFAARSLGRLRRPRVEPAALHAA